jgi:hypothetical protein
MSNSPPAFLVPSKLEQQTLEIAARRASQIRPQYPMLGTCFFNSQWSPGIHPRLKMLIRSFQDIISIYENTLRFDSELALVDHTSALLLVNRIYALPFDYAISSLDDTLRLGIMIYTLTRVWTLQGSLEYLLQNLRERIENILGYLLESAPDLFFWIVFIGCLASTGYDCHEWYVTHLRVSCKNLALDGWGEAVQVLETFFFVCRSKDESAKGIWECSMQEKYN